MRNNVIQIQFNLPEKQYPSGFSATTTDKFFTI